MDVASVARVGDTFHHTREPDPAWVAALREVSPVSDQHSWLSFQWYAPAQRWVLYEMVPRAFIPDTLVHEFEGPHPDTLPAGDTVISALQWALYKAHRAWARPFWVLQGTKGGHKVTLTKQEQQALRLAGQKPEAPHVGALPYCGFDGRTVAALQRHDRLKRFGGDVGALRRAATTEEQLREARDADQAFRAQMVDWLAAQMEESTEHFQRAAAAGDVTGAPTRIDWAAKDEAATAQYIETGHITA